MHKNKVLLSICIPTFNRSTALRETLESIVTQEVFTDTSAVEIVISDNASTDDTPSVVSEYVRRFPGKIVAYRQEVNIWSANFHHVLSMGSGQYLKLHNDTLLVGPDALQPLVGAIREFSETRPLIFMTNGNRVDDGKVLFAQCQSLDEFVQTVSFFSTWIGGFGLWREELDLALPFKSDASNLVQTDIVCRQMAAGRQAVVFFGTYFLSKQDFRRVYNWTEVFGKNYLSILKQHVAAGQLGLATYEKAKKEVLFRHILPNYFKAGDDFGKEGFFEHLSDYRDDDYFYEAITNHMVPLWRSNNPHNQTVVRNVSSPHLLARMYVGDKSRGSLNVYGPKNSEALLRIGRFVSIGDNVTFILGEHVPPGDTFSNYWLSAPPSSAGNITIYADTWIGSGAVLMSGVTVARGAIIAPASVVTEDVPPYSRVSGNPARVDSYRFDAETIEKLMAFDFTLLNDAVIAQVESSLSLPLSKENVDALLGSIKAAAQALAEPVTQPTAPMAAQEQQGVSEPTDEQKQPVLPGIPAVLILDAAGDGQRVGFSLAALAAGPHRELPAIVLTTQSAELPEWTDSLRYVQVGTDEYADAVEQLRVLPDFEWVTVIEAGQ